MVLEIDSGRARQLTRKARLFAPAPSPDGARLAAVEFGPDRRCHLVLLETATGAEEARFSAPEGVLWRRPAWSEDGRHIAVVRQDEGGNALERIDAADGRGEIVVPHTHDVIGWPVFRGPYLLYDSPRSGIDNIHAVHLPSGARYQVTSRPLAATRAAVAGDSLLFQEYTVDGYRIAAMALDPAAWTPAELRGPPGALLRAAHRPGAGRAFVDGHPAAVLAGERLSAPGESAQSPQLVLQRPAAAPLPHPHFQRSARSQQHERRRRVQQQRGRLQCPGRSPPGGVVSRARCRRPLG